METTLNVDVDILSRISRAAHLKGISRTDMIIFLIKKTMDDVFLEAHMGKMVRYQEKRNTKEWHAFHVRLRMDDYEYFLDLRKLLKMSVSLILAYAVEKFLDEVLKKSISDNYRYINYTVIREVVDNIISWKFIWGFPVNFIKQLKL